MFYNSNIIWQHERLKKPQHAENRLVHVGKWEKFKAYASKSKELTKKGFIFGQRNKLAKLLLSPLTVPTKIVTGGVKKIWGGAEIAGGYAGKGIDAGRFVGNAAMETGKEAGKGILKGGVQSNLTLIEGVGEDLKKNLIDNPVTLMKGVIEIPKNTLAIPKNFVGGVRESVSNVFNHSKEAVAHSKNTLSSLVSLDIKQAAISTAKAFRSSFRGVLSTIGTPFNPFYQAAKPFAERPIEAGKNIIDAKTQYIDKIKTSGSQFVEGTKQFFKAPFTGWQNAKGVTAAGAAERAKKAKELEKAANPEAANDNKMKDKKPEAEKEAA